MALNRSRVSVLATMAAISALAGCGGGDGGGNGPTDPEYDLAVIVEGTVLDAAAQPIFGVTVRITAYFWNGAVCTTEPVGPSVTTTVTEEGAFSRTIGFEGPSDEEIDACLTIEALPPDGYYPDTRSNIRAEIRSLADGVDLVEVALILEPTP